MYKIILEKDTITYTLRVYHAVSLLGTKHQMCYKKSWYRENSQKDIFIYEMVSVYIKTQC